MPDRSAVSIELEFVNKNNLSKGHNYLASHNHENYLYSSVIMATETTEIAGEALSENLTYLSSMNLWALTSSGISKLHPQPRRPHEGMYILQSASHVMKSSLIVADITLGLYSRLRRGQLLEVSWSRNLSGKDHKVY